MEHWSADIDHGVLIITGPGSTEIFIRDFQPGRTTEVYKPHQLGRERISSYLFDKRLDYEPLNMLRVTTIFSDEWRSDILRCGHASWIVPSSFAEGLFEIMRGDSLYFCDDVEA